MRKVIILKGLPASGKSTWAKEYIKSHQRTKRVNKDLLREMLDFSKYSKENEKIILQVRDTLILKFLNEGYDVIVDDTNLSSKHENRIRSILPNDVEVIINDDFLKVPLEKCIERDAKRENPVGKKVIIDMYRRFLMHNSTSIHLDNYKHGLKEAVICDLDGTLAIHEGRNAYDYDNAINDLVNLPIANLIRYLYDNYIIILVSGREDYSMEITEKWLKMHDIPYHYIYMRQSGDYRKDYIIKEEIYNEFIKDKFNILMVIDDRPQVIEMWKKQNLSVFDVGYGIDF